MKCFVVDTVLGRVEHSGDWESCVSFRTHVRALRLANADNLTIAKGVKVRDAILVGKTFVDKS